MKFKNLILAFAAASTFLFFSCDTPSYSKRDYTYLAAMIANSKAVYSSPSNSDVTIPVESEVGASNINSSDFIRGFDASMLYDLEKAGAVYYNLSNKQQDMLAILANNGVNCIRLRVWNEPYNPAYLPNDFPNYGYNNIEKTAVIAKRAKNLGMKVLIDFHYSDTWAHHGQQLVPRSWDKYTTIADLAQAVYDYTYNCINYLIDQGVTPEFVQIGNEIDSGMFLTSSSNGTAGVTAKSSSSNFATVLGMAASAVRTASSSTEIIIHVAENKNYGTITKLSGVDYDAVGVSYYPWIKSHGTISSLKKNLEAIVASGKKAYVVETSFPWTCEWVDGKNDTLNNMVWYTGDESTASAYTNLSSSLNYYGIASEDYNGTTVATASYQNQAAVLKAVISTVGEAGGSGVFYWGGDWVATTSILSNYENQTVFDLDGKAMPSIAVFGGKAEYVENTSSSTETTTNDDDTTETALITAFANDTANVSFTGTGGSTYTLLIAYDTIKDYEKVYITLANLTAWGDGDPEKPMLGTSSSAWKVNTEWENNGSHTDSNAKDSSVTNYGGGYFASISPSDYTNGVYILAKSGVSGTLYVTGIKNTGGGTVTKELLSNKEYTISSADTYTSILESSNFADLSITKLTITTSSSDTGAWCSASASSSWNTDTYQSNLINTTTDITSETFISALKTNGLYIQTSAGTFTVSVTVTYTE